MHWKIHLNAEHITHKKILGIYFSEQQRLFQKEDLSTHYQ